MKADFLERTSFDYFVKGLDFWRRDVLDRLDKIEQHRGLTGTAGDKPLEPSFRYSHRINKAIIDSAGWPSPEILDEIAKLHRAAGKCRCSYDPYCPTHGLCGRGFRESPTVTGTIEESTPDLPLHVRVAKALGHACWTDQGGKWRSHMGRFIPNGVEYPFIPDYPNDLVAAMGALEEYRAIVNKQNPAYDAGIEIMHKKRVHRGKWVVEIELPTTSNGAWAESDSLPQAICEAICKHAEGK